MSFGRFHCLQFLYCLKLWLLREIQVPVEVLDINFSPYQFQNKTSCDSHLLSEISLFKPFMTCITWSLAPEAWFFPYQPVWPNFIINLNQFLCISWLRLHGESTALSLNPGQGQLAHTPCKCSLLVDKWVPGKIRKRYFLVTRVLHLPCVLGK